MDDQNKNMPRSTEDELDELLAQFLASEDDSIPSHVICATEPEAPVPQEDTPWLDDILDTPAAAPEIGPDEQAVAAAGLTHPEDAELEQIIQLTKAADWKTDTTAIPAVSDPQEPFLDADIRDAFDEGKTLDAVFTEDATLAPPPEQKAPEAPAVPETDIPVQKTVPKKKNTYGLLGIPHMLSTVVWIVLAVAIGAALGRIIWVCASDVLAFGREDNSVTITITADDDLDSITDKLHKTGLIEYPSLFKLYANISNAMDKIDTGIYELNTLYDYHALVLLMSSTSNRVTVDVMIPEGYNCAQIFQLLQDKGVCTVEALEEAAAYGELGEFWFLEGLERGTKNCLEGYLFPDTYEFYANDNPVRVLNKLMSNFDNRFTENMVEQLTSLNAALAAKMKKNGLSQEYIDAHQVTIREVVIVASLIEKESASVPESYNISSVIYNRLTNPEKYPKLDIKSSLLYITGGHELTEEDKALDTPYNTYLYEGLIPTPIANPSQDSLKAALEPADTNYYYYALDLETNRHHFSATEKEHQAFLDSLKSEG